MHEQVIWEVNPIYSNSYFGRTNECVLMCITRCNNNAGGQKNLALCEKALPSNCYVGPCS